LHVGELLGDVLKVRLEPDDAVAGVVGHFLITRIAATAATAVDAPMKNEVKIACSVLSGLSIPRARKS
jgi:hypothetical protein